MEIFKLQDHMKDATAVGDIAGVYWSSRDLESFFIGNHHFITFIFEAEDQARRITEAWNIGYFSETNDQGLEIFYCTMGAGKGAGTKSIEIHFSPESDRTSIHEIAKEENTSFFSKDYDFQGHRVPAELASPVLATDEALMEAILERVSNFNAHFEAGDRVAYSLIDENCACIVNSIFNVIGYPSSVRQELGEFWGVDWGEEDLIPARYFEKMLYLGNSNTKEVHLPGCEWTDKILPEHIEYFEHIEDAVAEGYNGCHYCLDSRDTD